MVSSESVLIGIATYNERENLPVLIERLRSVLPHADVLVVDDNSPDGTAAWCESYQGEHGTLRLIRRAGKLGLASAVHTMIDDAIANNYQWLVTMDGDLSHHPEELPKILQARASADVVIGSRYVPGGSIREWSWCRRAASRMTNVFSRTALRLKVHDSSSGFRCYRVSSLARLDRDSFIADGYAFYEEVLWRLQRQHATMVEVPITFVDRTAGQSKADWLQATKAIGQLLRLLWKG